MHRPAVLHLVTDAKAGDASDLLAATSGTRIVVHAPAGTDLTGFAAGAIAAQCVVQPTAELDGLVSAAVAACRRERIAVICAWGDAARWGSAVAARAGLPWTWRPTGDGPVPDVALTADAILATTGDPIPAAGPVRVVARAGDGPAATGTAAADAEEQWIALADTGRPGPRVQHSREATPTVSIVVLTYRRAAILVRTLEALAAQTYPQDRREVIVVVNGADADTDAALRDRTDVRVVRLEHPHPVPVARNAGVAVATGELLAMTDDDCRPVPEWLECLVAGLHDGVALVQGRTMPDPEQPQVPLSRSQSTPFGYGLFETCNIIYDRALLGDAPFDPTFAADLERRYGDAFSAGQPGEDVDLGWRLLASGHRARFCATALVHHEVHPPSSAALLTRARQAGAFPFLVQRHPGLRKAFLTHTYLLGPHQVRVWSGLCGALLTIARRDPRWLVLAGPLLRHHWRTTGRGVTRLRAIPVLLRADAAQALALARSSWDSRTPVL